MDVQDHRRHRHRNGPGPCLQEHHHPAASRPANTTATLYLPALDLAGITESRRPALQAEKVRFIGMLDGNAIFEIGSGHYRFQSPWP